MLTLISWQQYLLAVSVLTASYYIVVLWLYYKNEVIAFFSRKKQETTYSHAGSHSSILGPARQPENHSLLSADELQISSETN